MRNYLFGFALALFGAPVFAQDPDSQLAAGLEAYEFFCSKCHGKEMVNAGVSSYDLRKFPTDQKDRFYDSVKNGRGDMPAWGDVIYPEELDALWYYVATRGGTQPLPENSEEGASLPPVQEFVSAGQLTACLARNSGAVSGRRSNGGTGLDYRISEALAAALGLELNVTWFENELGEESDPVLETYAMLAYPLCDVALSHPLYAPAVGEPPAPKGPLPRWLGMPTERDAETGRQVDMHPPFVDLRAISVTLPYMRAEIGLVYREGEVEPTNLSDLKGRRFAVQQGTLSAALATVASPDLTSSAVTFNPGAGFLWHLEQGTADVAIVDVAAFDGYRKHNKVTKLRLSEWRHPFGFDVGIALLSERVALREVANETIAALAENGTLAKLAQEEGLTYASPRSSQLEPALNARRLFSLD